MDPSVKSKPHWMNGLRLFARAAALFITFLIIYLFYDEAAGVIPVDLPELRTGDNQVLALVALYIAGLITGFWREGLGGVMSLYFYAILVITCPACRSNGIWSHFLILTPVILYFMSWYFHRLWRRKQVREEMFYTEIRQSPSPAQLSETDESGPVEVFTGPAWECGLVKSLLENAEIKTDIFYGGSGTMGPWDSNGCFPMNRLMVSRRNHEKAKEVIEQYADSVRDASTPEE
jgi:hypothetical protein